VIGAGLIADADGSAEYRAVRAAIQGIQLRRTGHAAQAADMLENADVSGRSNSQAAQLVRLHLAHALRNQGDYVRAAEIYRGLLGGPFAAGAHYWLCDFDYLNGRFATAVAALVGQRGGSAAEEGERLRLIGHIWRVNARFEEAAEVYREAIALARGEGMVAAEAKALANLAQTACWSGDAVGVSEAASQARELLDLVPNPVELVKVRSAEATAAAIAGDLVACRDAIGDTRRLADEIGYRGGHNLADVADIVSGVLSGDLDLARLRRSELDERTRESGGNTYWVPIVTCWLDGVETALGHRPAVEWIDDPSASLRRWDDVVTRR
jgi:tetratricopeptide (TPR) repeat protein